MIIGRPIAKVIDYITGLCAMATLVLMLIYYINASWSILPTSAMLSIIRWKDILTLATLLLASVEFALRRNVILFIIFAVIIVAVSVFVFYSFKAEPAAAEAAVTALQSAF